MPHASRLDLGPGPSATVRPLVRRQTLLSRLASGDGARIAVLSAPAGSGKSTLLAQWATDEPRPVAWLQLGAEHADPVLVLAGCADAIAEASPGGPVSELAPRLVGREPLRDQARLVRAMAAEGTGGLLIVDDVHRLRDRLESLDVLVTLVDHLPPGWSVALAQREEVGLPVGRWRLAPSSVLLETRDLMLDEGECQQLLASLGLDATESLAREVRARTEGWAAGVYLAALALRSDRPLHDGALVAGDDRLVRSYLDSEILSTIDPGDRELLVVTSFLDQVSGTLADAVTGSTGSGERLRRIAARNLLVTALDRQERWFRCHSLLRERLERELRDRPGVMPALHARASAWYLAEGRTDDAIDQALRSGMDELAARLVVGSMLRAYRTGRVQTLRDWFGRFAPATIAADPQLARAALLIAMVEGDTDGVVRWSAAAGLERAEPTEPQVPPDGIDPFLLRSLQCAAGATRAVADATRSLALHDEAWPFRPLALLASASARIALGDQEGAMAACLQLEHTPEGSTAVARLPLRSERALDAMARHAWTEAEAILALDRSAMLGDPDTGRIAGVLWFAADARMSLRRGDVRGAQERLRRAMLRRPLLSWAVPAFAVRSLTVLAQVQLQVDDPAGARASLAQARDILRTRPDLGVLSATLRETAERARRAPGADVALNTLSPAELRLLPLLQTWLSFKEIGERLGISGNTVKTQAMSIYAKLGATSRTEAVERAIAAGLLENPFD